MIPDIRTVQGELEGRSSSDQPDVEKAALKLYARLARRGPATTSPVTAWRRATG